MASRKRESSLSFSTGSDGVPVFKPSANEFKDFNKYMKKIEQSTAAEIGIAKVIPPSNWVARKGEYDSIDLKIPVPLLQKISGTDGHFMQINTEKEAMTVKEYHKMANSIQYCTPVHENYDELESIYWKNLKYAQPIYGADVNGTLMDKDQTQWNLSNLGSILDLITKKSKRIAGVNSPYLYFGMWKTTFPWHTEDMDLYAINYLHYGAAKSWYCVPPQHGRRLERMAAGYYPGEADVCSAFMRHKTIVMTPKLLKTYSIPVHKVTQEAGQFIITFPFSYHMGYNNGYNIAEAVNFATPKWIDVAKESIQCNCKKASTSVCFDLGPFVQQYQPKQYAKWRKEHPEEPVTDFSDAESPDEKKLVIPPSSKEEEKRTLGRLTNNSLSTATTAQLQQKNIITEKGDKKEIDLKCEKKLKSESLFNWKEKTVVKIGRDFFPTTKHDRLKVKAQNIGHKKYSSDEGFSSANDDEKPSTSKQKQKQRRNIRSRKSSRVFKEDECDSDDQPVCNQELSTIDLHLKLLPEVKSPYWCGYCGDVFESSDLLKQHLSIHSAMEPHRCDLCGRRFAEKSDCEAHVLSYIIPAPLKCSKSPSGHFVCHPALTEIGTPYPFIRTVPCHLCLNTFDDRFLLRRHLLDHKKGTTKPQVKARGRRAASKTPSTTSLQSNASSWGVVPKNLIIESDNASMSSTGDAVTHKCEHCPEVKFYTLDTYRAHLRAHKGSQKFKCDCGAKMDSADEFRKHMTKEHGSIKNEQKRTSNRSKAKVSVTVSSPGRRIRSDSASINIINAISNKSLQDKYKKWVEKKITYCESCNQNFSNVYSLIRHQSVHTGIKPFACNKCPYKTSCNTELTRHLNLKHASKGNKAKNSVAAKKLAAAKKKIIPARRQSTPINRKSVPRRASESEDLKEKLARKQREIDSGMRRSIRTILLESQPSDNKKQEETKVKNAIETVNENRRELRKPQNSNPVKVSPPKTIKKPVKKNLVVEKAKKVVQRAKISCPHCKLSFKTNANKRIHTRNCSKKPTPQKSKPISTKTPSPKPSYSKNFMNTDDSDTDEHELSSAENDGPKLFRCMNCFKEFNEEQSLRYHSMYDACVPVYRCEECNKAFTRRTAYESHCIMHDMEREAARKKAKELKLKAAKTAKAEKKRAMKRLKSAQKAKAKAAAAAQQEAKRRRRQSSSTSATYGKRKKGNLDDSISSEERDTLDPVIQRPTPVGSAPIRKHRRSSCEDASSGLFNFGSMLYWNEDSANDEEATSLQPSSSGNQHHPHSEDLSDLAMVASTVTGTSTLQNTSQTAAQGIHKTGGEALKSDSESASDLNVMSGSSPRGEGDISSSEESRRKTTARRRITKKMHPDFVTTTHKKKVRGSKKVPKHAAAGDLGGISIPAGTAQSVVIGSTGSISNIPVAPGGKSITPGNQKILMVSPPAGQPGVMRLISPTTGPQQPVTFNRDAEKSLRQHLMSKPASSNVNIQTVSPGQTSPIKQQISVARNQSGVISVRNPSGVQIRSTDLQAAMGEQQQQHMIFIKKRGSNDSVVHVPKKSMYMPTPHISDVAAVCEIKNSQTPGSGMSLVGTMSALVSGHRSESPDRGPSNLEASQPGPSGISRSRLDVNMSGLDGTAFRHGRGSTQHSGSHITVAASDHLFDDHGYCKKSGPASINLENVIDML